MYTNSKNYKDNLENRPGTRPLSLAGSIPTAFVLFGSAVSVCRLTFASESFWYEKKTPGLEIVRRMDELVSLSRRMYVLCCIE
jgi:hypothetical protein